MLRFPSGSVLLERAADYLGLGDSLEPRLRKALQRVGDDENPVGVSHQLQEEIISALVVAWIGAPSDAVHCAIHDYLRHWDELAAELNTGAVRPEDFGLRVYPLLRLASFDLALRCVGLTILAPARASSLALPTLDADWLDPAPMQRCIDRLRGGISLEVVAHRSALSPQTLARWRSGEDVPRSENLRQLASALAGTGRDSAATERMLRVAAVAQRLRGWLAGHLDPRLVADLAGATALLANAGTQALLAGARVSADQLTELVRLGAAAPIAPRLIEALSGRLTHRGVRDDLAALNGDWVRRVRFWLQLIGTDAELVPSIERELGGRLEPGMLNGIRSILLLIGDPFAKAGGPPLPTLRQLQVDPQFVANELERQASEAQSRGDLETALAALQMAVRLAPTNARHRFQLGAFLGQVGGRSGLLQAALEHLRAAAVLDPAWPRPITEVGIVLSNHGLLKEAEDAYAAAETVANGWSHFHYARGVNAHQLQAWDNAERYLRKALELEPASDAALPWLVRLLESTGRSRNPETRTLARLLDKRNPRWRADFERGNAGG